MPVYCRPANADDIDTCITLRGQTRENAISRQQLADLGITLASWSAEVVSGKLVGFAGVSNAGIVGYCFGDTGTGEIVVLALLPAAEEKGLGKALLSRVVRQLVALGHGRLHLACSNDPAVRSYGFYRHLGWRSTGAIDGRGDEILELATAVHPTKPWTPADVEHTAGLVGLSVLDAAAAGFDGGAADQAGRHR